MKWLQELGDMLLGYAGILMAAIAGVFELIRDRFGSRFTGKAWQSLSMVGVFGGMLWALLATQHDAKEHRQEMESTITSVNDWVSKQVTEGTTTVVKHTDVIEAKLDVLINGLHDQGVLPSIAQTVSLDQAGNILKAGQAARSRIGSEPASNRQGLTIHYFDHFTKDVNFEKVKPLLNQLAAQVEPYTPLVEAPTNSVWWGPGSGIEQAKTVALVVTGAGVPVVQICPSKKPHPNIANLIQIGGSARAQREGMKPMTAEEIQGLTAPRCAEGPAPEQ
jgi:hypothetical protein